MKKKYEGKSFEELLEMIEDVSNELYDRVKKVGSNLTTDHAFNNIWNAVTVFKEAVHKKSKKQSSENQFGKAVQKFKEDQQHIRTTSP